MSRIGQIVFAANGTAGMHCGFDHDGNELVTWMGKPEIVAADVDEKGDGNAPYATSYPVPETEYDANRSGTRDY